MELSEHRSRPAEQAARSCSPSTAAEVSYDSTLADETFSAVLGKQDQAIWRFGTAASAGCLPLQPAGSQRCRQHASGLCSAAPIRHTLASQGGRLQASQACPAPA